MRWYHTLKTVAVLVAVPFVFDVIAPRAEDGSDDFVARMGMLYGAICVGIAFWALEAWQAWTMHWTRRTNRRTP